MLRKIILIFIFLKCACGAKILGVFPMPGTSHYILASKLMKGLAEAGHEVTVISPYKMNDPPKNGKYTDVILDGFKEDFQRLRERQNLFALDSKNYIDKTRSFLNNFLQNSNKTLYDPNVKKLIESKEKFDAVIMEQFSNDALKVFSHIYDCPLIILSSLGPHFLINPLVGNPQPVSTVAHLNAGNFSADSILHRLHNLFLNVLDYFSIYYYVLPKHEEIMHQVFPDAPPLYDLYTNVSLILLNSHSSLFKAVPVVPNMVEIGGFFIDAPQKLPKDLQEFLDNAKDGAIYFSMGSTIKSMDMSARKRKVILSVFGKLKQKVLWKFEEDLPGKPPNVMIRKWLPQQDILAHPNIKLFISHGGLLSTTETIYHGVPVLAIPVFGDQFLNADKAVTSGFGLRLDYNDPNFTEERFGVLVNELLQNLNYKKNAQHRSNIFHDRPMKPMETAVYWVEYVIRHKGAGHLRVAGVRMSWYKYFMVDVIGCLILATYVLKVLFTNLICRVKNIIYTLKKLKQN